MTTMDPNLDANRQMWDRWTPIHAASKFYDLEGFKEGRCSLQAIERQEVGDVAGKSLLHLQCHFGMDTLSWARRGASVAGVDFSEKAIALAGALAAELGIPAEFYLCDVYSLSERLKRQFDIVYTAMGVLPWLPDLSRWAEVIAGLLRPGGFFYIREDHPLALIFDDERDVARLAIKYPYFHSDRPIRCEGRGSYADPQADVDSKHYEWSHSLADVIDVLISAGLSIRWLHEFPFSTYQSLPFLVQGVDGLWRYPDASLSLPLMFSIKAARE